MNVYRFVADSDKYHCLDNEGNWNMLKDGKPIARSWTPISVPYYVRTGRPGDFPELKGSVPVFSEKAWMILEPLIGSLVEALPLIVDSQVLYGKTGKRTIVPASNYGRYYAINVLNVLDCLDADRSDVLRISAGAVIHIKSYVFNSGSIKSTDHIFKIVETKWLEVFVSETFKETVEARGLVGAYFVQVA